MAPVVLVLLVPAGMNPACGRVVVHAGGMVGQDLRDVASDGKPLGLVEKRAGLRLVGRFAQRVGVEGGQAVCRADPGRRNRAPFLPALPQLRPQVAVRDVEPTITQARNVSRCHVLPPYEPVFLPGTGRHVRVCPFRRRHISNR